MTPVKNNSEIFFSARLSNVIYCNFPLTGNNPVDVLNNLRTKNTFRHETLAHDFWYWLKAAVKMLLIE